MEPAASFSPAVRVDDPSAQARLALALALVPLLDLAVFAFSPVLGWVLSPLAFIGALAAVLLAIVARRRVARIYALGEQAFQPVEAELIHARALSAWALGVALAALPVYALFVAVLLYF